MENSNANKLINELVNQTEINGIQVSQAIETLKKIREYAMEENKPTVVKSIRLVYEHLEENNDFLVGIPSDEPIEEISTNREEVSNTESFKYYLSLLLDLENKHNILDIKDYNKRLLP